MFNRPNRFAYHEETDVSEVLQRNLFLKCLCGREYAQHPTTGIYITWVYHYVVTGFCVACCRTHTTLGPCTDH